MFRVTAEVLNGSPPRAGIGRHHRVKRAADAAHETREIRRLLAAPQPQRHTSEAAIHRDDSGCPAEHQQPQRAGTTEMRKVARSEQRLTQRPAQAPRKVRLAREHGRADVKRGDPDRKSVV